ncbi:unnamed protein product [Durusdinium trenchii]|uniref:Uncharacterized protein n=1 Tax=Durusdinium trenchii TaxID=1381693 RepID=A0ABP0IC89_9DINO
MFTDPDGDLYLEDLGGPDITAWRNYEPHGPTPFGINAHEIYPFRNLPGDAARNQLMIEGERHAAAERIHLGLPHPPPGGSAAVAPVAAAAAPANPGGGAVGGAALVAPLAGAAAVGARPNIAGGGGAAALAAALNQPPGGAQAMNSGLNGDDARTLPVTRDVDGNRFKEFRVGVQECKQSKFSDWPIGGPRTVRHVLMEMVNHGGSALAHHQAWRVACKFQPSDGPAVEHEGLCKILQTMLTYDQLEEKHKFKLQASDESGEGALFMGAMGGARVGSVVSPKLTEWVGGELQKEALVAKERRKTYDSGRSDVEPYVKENISWPEVSNCPVALDNCLPPADREWLGDLTNAVYTLAVPDGIAEMFTMPGIEAGKVGVSDIAGTPTDPETIVLPYVTVLPMGGVGLFTFVSCEPSVAEVVDRHVSRHLLRQAKTKLRGSIPEGLTYLEARSVREPTRLDYMRRIKDFNHWLGPHVVDFTNPLDVDNILVEYLQDLFDSGFKVDSGIRIHAAIRFCHPQLGKSASGSLPRCLRALRGWKNADPPLQRMPLPIEGFGAILGYCIATNFLEMAVHLFQWTTYMRPGEASSLTTNQLIPPMSRSDSSVQFFAVLLHPAEGRVPGKTGHFDQGILLDSDLWINPILMKLIHMKKPSTPLWNHTHMEILNVFQKAVKYLQLEPLGVSMYTLRHGGASYDIISQRKTMDEVKVLEADGYKAPELPYLAWVPCEGQRQLMCLLCRNSRRKQGTWVSDETAHCGTHENPAGSKEHRKNLLNYPPGDPWYEQNVTAARLEFHPKLEVSRAKTASESRRELYTDLPLRSEEEEEHFCQILSWLLSHKVKSCR